MLIRGKAVSKMAQAAVKAVDDLIRLPPDLVAAALAGSTVFAFMSTLGTEADVGLETIFIGEDKPSSEHWVLEGVIDAQAALAPPLRSYFRDEAELRTEVPIYTAYERPDPRTGPRAAFDPDRLYYIQVDRVGLEVPSGGGFGVLTPTPQAWWPVFSLESNMTRAQIVGEYVQSHALWIRALPITANLPDGVRPAWESLLDLAIRSFLDHTQAEAIAAADRTDHSPEGGGPLPPTLHFQAFDARIGRFPIHMDAPLLDDQELWIYCSTDRSLIENTNFSNPNIDWLIRQKRLKNLIVEKQIKQQDIDKNGGVRIVAFPHHNKVLHCRYVVRNTERRILGFVRDWFLAHRQFDETMSVREFAQYDLGGENFDFDRYLTDFGGIHRGLDLFRNLEAGTRVSEFVRKHPNKGTGELIKLLEEELLAVPPDSQPSLPFSLVTPVSDRQVRAWFDPQQNAVMVTTDLKLAGGTVFVALFKDSDVDGDLLGYAWYTEDGEHLEPYPEGRGIPITATGESGLILKNNHRNRSGKKEQTLLEFLEGAENVSVSVAYGPSKKLKTSSESWTFTEIVPLEGLGDGRKPASGNRGESTE